MPRWMCLLGVLVCVCVCFYFFFNFQILSIFQILRKLVCTFSTGSTEVFDRSIPLLPKLLLLTRRTGEFWVEFCCCWCDCCCCCFLSRNWCPMEKLELRSRFELDLYRELLLLLLLLLLLFMWCCWWWWWCATPWMGDCGVVGVLVDVDVFELCDDDVLLVVVVVVVEEAWCIRDNESMWRTFVDSDSRLAFGIGEFLAAAAAAAVATLMLVAPFVVVVVVARCVGDTFGVDIGIDELLRLLVLFNDKSLRKLCAESGR